jgi:hypothetical protein
MRAPEQEPLWAPIKAAIERLGVDPDAPLITSRLSGGKVSARDELRLIGEVAISLREEKDPAARTIATVIQKVLADIESAEAGVKDLAGQHWPRRRLYSTADALLATAELALRKAADTLHPEHDALAAAPSASKANASSVETYFRGHVLRVWQELGGDPDSNPSDAIDFLLACETWMFGRCKRGSLGKWLGRHRKADKAH